MCLFSANQGQSCQIQQLQYTEFFIMGSIERVHRKSFGSLQTHWESFVVACINLVSKVSFWTFPVYVNLLNLATSWPESLKIWWYWILFFYNGDFKCTITSMHVAYLWGVLYQMQHVQGRCSYHIRHVRWPQKECACYIMTYLIIFWAYNIKGPSVFFFFFVITVV